MLIAIEGIVVCFILLIVCVVGLKEGPEKFAVFYEEMPYIPVKVKIKKLA